MKQYRYIAYLLLLSIAVSPGGYAQSGDRTLVPKEKTVPQKIVILNYATIGEHEKHEYYSFIIPQTIAKSLMNNGEYTVQRIQETLPLAKDTLSDTILLKNLSAKYPSDYIIFGSVEVAEKTLKITTTIYNVKRADSRVIHSSSSEVGALLKESINEVTSDTRQTIEELTRENRVQFAPSPFLGLYKAFNSFSFGFDGGRFFIIGTWDNRFKDAYFIRSYIQYRIVEWFGLSLNLDYLSTDHKDDTYYSILYQWTPTLALHFFIPLSRYFAINYSLGSGVSFTRINRQIRDASSPFDTIEGRRYSRDPYLDTSLACVITVSPIVFKIGSSYRVTFIYGGQLQLVTTFIGIGYSF